MINNIPIIEYKQKEVFTIIYTGHDLEPEHYNSCINNPYMASIYQLLPDYYQPHYAQLLQQLNLSEYSDYFTYEWDRYSLPNPNANIYIQFFMMLTFFNLYLDEHSDINDAANIIDKMVNIAHEHMHNNEITDGVVNDNLPAICKNIYYIMYAHYRHFFILAE